MNEFIKDLLKEPTATALLGLFVGFIGGIATSLINWRKDLSIARLQQRTEYLKNAIAELKVFVSQAVVNVPDVNAKHKDTGQAMRTFYKKRLAAFDPCAIEKEWKDCFQEYHKIIATYMSVRHFITTNDRQFLDGLHQEISKIFFKEQETATDHINAVIAFRTLIACMYVSMLKNLEHISKRMGL
jgi:hypothetical protein